MVNKLKYIIIVIVLFWAILFTVSQFSTKGCASCDYMKGIRNSSGPCNLICMHVPQEKITLFELTGHKIR